MTPEGRAAADVHGGIVNSLIPSSGGKAEQPSTRPDLWPLLIFTNILFQSKVDSSVQCLCESKRC